VSVEVTPVRGRRDLRAFVELPFHLHSNAPQWVPPLKLERYMHLSRRFNVFFERGEAELFLARREGKVCGRISAQVDHAFNRHQGNRWGLFGFLEMVDDPEVCSALFEAATEWLRSKDRDRIVGPMDFTMNDEVGVLIEGHELDPMVRQPWQPPYYKERIEEAGFGKAIDLFMWHLMVSDRTKVLPVIFDMAEKLESEHGITIRKMSRRRLRKDLDSFAEVYNAAWADNWGFVPYSKKDLDGYWAELQLVFDKNWFMVAEKDGETVGMAITVPDVNQVLRKMNGSLLPFGWWHFLRKGKTVDRVRVGFLGVKPEFQHTGVAAGLYVEHFDMAAATPQTGGEMGWILETNEAMNRGMEAMGGQIVKRYRVYEREI
jgi:GNAT superfamily N-acetyltransferase